MDEPPRPAQDIHASVHAWMGVDGRRGSGSGSGGEEGEEERRRRKEGGDDSRVHPPQGPDQPAGQSTNQLADRQFDGPTIPRYVAIFLWEDEICENVSQCSRSADAI